MFTVHFSHHGLGAEWRCEVCRSALGIVGGFHVCLHDADVGVLGQTNYRFLIVLDH